MISAPKLEREFCRELLRVHFPKSTQIDDTYDRQGLQNLDVCRCKMNMRNWNLARNVINKSTFAYLIGTFLSWNQQQHTKLYRHFCRVEQSGPYLRHTFRACLAYGWFFVALRQVRVTVIPKPGKPDYTEPNTLIPQPFLLKTMEKLLDRYTLIKDCVLKGILCFPNRNPPNMHFTM